jgi:Fe-S cluster assembly protein SufD
VQHATPNCESHQDYKAYSLIVQAFSGKFFVKEKLKKTNAFKQQGDKATINKPQLEIFADDVKCSHGLLSWST